MITRHDMTILKRAQRQLYNLAMVAEKMGKTNAAHDLETESAVLVKVISYLEDLQKMKK